MKDLPTVADASVNFGASKLTVYGHADVQQLEKAGAFENLKVYPENEQPSSNHKAPLWKNRDLQQILVSVLLLIAAWLIDFQFHGPDWLAITASMASIVISGYRLIQTGLKSLVQLQFEMNTLMTIAVIGAVAIGSWGEAAVVVILFGISELLEHYSMDKARDSIRSLMEIAPKEATVRRGDKEMNIAIDDIQIGDVMIVKPGQKLAMDGIVIKGTSAINQAAITGESVPVTKTMEDEVYAGTLNEEGLLEVKVTKRSEDTTLARIIHLVEEAQAERAPSQAFVDRFAKYYTPAIMAAAVILAVAPPLLLGADWGSWIYRGLALLIVGCPCALIISTPVSIVTAIGNAARNGVLIKGGIHLEEMGSIKAIAFDKTGTLTKGIPEVKDVIPLSEMDENEVLTIAATLERGSQHPLASAILRKAGKNGIELPNSELDNFSSLTGKGVKASINGTVYHIGNPSLFKELEFDLTIVKERIRALQAEGKTVMVLGTGIEVKGLIAVVDEVREHAEKIIGKLYNAGIDQTVMLTGDNTATAKAIGKQLGITDVKAELLPEEKLAAIKQLRQTHKKVAMVGDGVNDAPALAASTVGIAMGGAGTDTALETADIALMADDLDKLPIALKLSRRALGIIKQNIIFAFAIKMAAIILIFPDWLTLWMAVIADMGATVIVTLNALRLLRVKD